MPTLKITNNAPTMYEGTLMFLKQMCTLQTTIHEVIRPTMVLPVLETHTYKCAYKGVDIQVHQTQSTDTHVMYNSRTALPVKSLFLDLNTDDSSFAETFLRDVEKFAKNDFKANSPEHIVHYVYTDFFDWEKSENYEKRHLDKLYLPADVEKSLVTDFNFFTERADGVYKQMGISSSRTYLLYGCPGTGKTTTAYVMASEMNLNICTVDFTNKIDDYTFRKCVKSVPPNSLLLLEDIDHLFAPQKARDELRHSITFSGLLNVLDGVAKLKKLICVITCNNIGALDKTFLRRIDYAVEFKNSVTEHQLTKFCRAMPVEVDSGPFVKFFKSKETTVNVIQKWMLTHLPYVLDGQYKLESEYPNFDEYNKWYTTNVNNMYL